MKNTMKIGVMLVLVGVLLAGCSNVFHNGTEMTVTQVKVTGVPANPYTSTVKMVFSYDTGSGWIHDAANKAKFDSAMYQASRAADGILTYTFSPALVITTPTLKFLLIDTATGWGTFQLDKKHSGKKGGDATLDNNWSAGQKILGVVSGDDVTWSYE